jgi:putative ABC transport system permease protein
MNIKASVRIALRSLRVNALRTILTMLGIIIGVGAVIAMISVGTGAQVRIQEQIQSMGSNLMIILSGSSAAGGIRWGHGSLQTLTEEDGKAIAIEVPGVQVVAPSMRGNAQVVAGNLNWSTQVFGVTPEYQEARDWYLSIGKFISEEDGDASAKVAVLGATVAENLFGGENSLGKIIRIKKVPFTVVGVLDRKGQSAWGLDQDDTILIPLSTAKKKVLGQNQANKRAVGTIAVKVKRDEDMKEVETQIRELLRQRHRLQPYQDDDFNIQILSELFAAQEESAGVMTMLLAAIASVSLLVGGIGIMNIMLVSVTERTREIGLRMAVGARARDILSQFLIEAVTLSLIGGLIGIAMGVASSELIAYFAEWSTILSAESILLAFGFAAAIGIFFGFYPARKASRLDPIEALRYE